MTTQCRSISPQPNEHTKGFPCTKERGHKRRWHSNPNATKRWENGINTPAKWEVKDDGYMSEADWQTWGRFNT